MEGITVTDLGLSVRDLETYLISSGYWADEILRARNACTLTPGALALSPASIASLDSLARETYAALKAVNAKLTALANARSVSNAEAAFVKIARRASRDLLAPGETAAVPPVVKLDLVVSADGTFKVVEADAYNPRGYGYLALLDGLVSARRVGTGIAGLARLMQSFETHAPWTFIVSDYERYYAPAFGILAGSLAHEGIDARVISESAAAHAAIHAVFAIPDTLHALPEVRTVLMERYRQGELVGFYPPVAYLGTKALLPALREAGAGEHIPRTVLVSRQSDPLASFAGASALKGVVSSGMKHVLFSDIDAEAFSAAYNEARSAKLPQWILQESVEQTPFSVPIYAASGERSRADYYLRVIAYATEDGLLGAEVTGRPDRRVHGAPDCIQIPVVRM